MAEKYIDLEGIQKERYVISDKGFVYDLNSNNVMPVHEGCIYLMSISKPSRVKSFGLGKLMMLSFKEHPSFDPHSKLIWVAHRNGNPDDFHINNLYWALFKSEIRIEDVYRIYDMLKHGITNPTEIGLRIGQYVSEGFVKRLYKASRAEQIAELLNVDYESIPNHRRHFGGNQDMLPLTEEQVVEICEALVKFGGDSRKVAAVIQFATLSQIRGIAYKHSYVSISDKYFDDHKILQREYHIPKPVDTDDEKWKQVPDHLLFPQSKGIVIYVSTKGRFMDSKGNELIVSPQAPMKAYQVRIGKKAHLCSRIILATHSLDLPALLNFPNDAFSVRYKDDDKSNLNVENLYWAPRHWFKRNNDNNIDLRLLNDLSVYLKDATDSTKGIAARKNCYKIIEDYQKHLKITLGYSYAYYTRTFESLEWKKCQNIEGEYYVSNNGIVRHKRMTMLVTHSTIEDERNYVTINENEYLVCKLVLKAFKPLKDYKNYFPHHIDGDLKNDNVDNLEWRYLSPETSVAKHKWHGHIKEEAVPIDWLDDVDPARYMLYNTGRVFDVLKNRWVRSYHGSNGAKYAKLNRTTTKRRKQFYIALNVIECFRPDLNIDNYVNSKQSSVKVIYNDGDPDNCTYKNLSLKLKKNHITRNIAEEICLAIISENGNVDKVVQNIQSKLGVCVSAATVWGIKGGRYFKDISKKYFDNEDLQYLNKRYRRVNKLSLDGLIITEYASIKDCLCDNPFIEYHGLRDHASPDGNRYKKPYKGFLWEYV